LLDIWGDVRSIAVLRYRDQGTVSIVKESKGDDNNLESCHDGVNSRLHGIIINVPVVYMARYVMVLRHATSITRSIARGKQYGCRVGFLALFFQCCVSYWGWGGCCERNVAVVMAM
jgi:hypothetical protein